MTPTFTTATILEALSPSSDANPFNMLSRGLQAELVPHTSESLRRGTYVLCGLMGLMKVSDFASLSPQLTCRGTHRLITDLITLSLRLSRGDSWLYRKQNRSQGTLIIPNTILNYVCSCLADAIFQTLTASRR